MAHVSVVIPTYNRSDLISETLDSVLAQTYRDFEIIVVDDGSTDNTSAVLSKYGSWIRVIWQSNQGEGPARNTGIRMATGEFVAFVDSDDIWLPTKLQRQMEWLSANPDLSWVYSDAEVFDGKTGRTLYCVGDRTRLYDGDVLEPLFIHDFIPSPTPVVRRKVFDTVGYFRNFSKGADWDMWLRIAACYPVGLVAEPLARYRVHQAMITASQNWQAAYDACLNVIEQAVMREPMRLEPLKRQAVFQLNMGTGRILARRGDLVQAREMFREAIRISPAAFQAYFLWGATLLGDGIMSRLIQTNQIWSKTRKRYTVRSSD